MSDHVHLLMETPGTPLSKIMQLINFTYTRSFNRKYGKVGHLFQGRYKAFLCDHDEYLLGLVRYIHLNPVRARVINNPHECEWSSHKDYLEGGKGLIDTDKVLRLFSERVPQARRLYKEFVNEAIDKGRDESFYKTGDQQLLGDERFKEKVEKKIGKLDRPLRKPPLRMIFKAIEEQTGIEHEEVVSRSRKEDVIFARGLLVGVWREVGYPMASLQPVLRRDLSVLSRLSKVVEDAKGRDAMRKLLKKLNA
ncbi:MAG: transposase [Nitrospirae bacterium]|nr:transposase [Nitrospirota bacterium]